MKEITTMKELVPFIAAPLAILVFSVDLICALVMWFSPSGGGMLFMLGTVPS
ncbi:hypothetical protein [Pigmentiphaga aceris]|uniref:hypothetical protein n=1 Tax=Pigmentiphaga aceris TaxID=1940612 RepID=UPI001652376A|nr:hypothetical protein [Pigmentiphaga aceris]